MVRPLAALVFCCALFSPAGAQQKPLTLTLEVEQAMLVVETLKAIRCDTVQQLIVCEKAKAILAAIQAQAREQSK